MSFELEEFSSKGPQLLGDSRAKHKARIADRKRELRRRQKEAIPPSDRLGCRVWMLALRHRINIPVQESGPFFCGTRSCEAVRQATRDGSASGGELDCKTLKASAAPAA